MILAAFLSGISESKSLSSLGQVTGAAWFSPKIRSNTPRTTSVIYFPSRARFRRNWRLLG